jgi:hypothetical protein
MCSPCLRWSTDARKKPWTCNALRLRIARLKAKINLPDELCAHM